MRKILSGLFGRPSGGATSTAAPAPASATVAAGSAGAAPAPVESRQSVEVWVEGKIFSAPAPPPGKRGTIIRSDDYLRTYHYSLELVIKIGDRNVLLGVLDPEECVDSAGSVVRPGASTG